MLSKIVSCSCCSPPAPLGPFTIPLCSSGVPFPIFSKVSQIADVGGQYTFHFGFPIQNPPHLWELWAQKPPFGTSGAPELARRGLGHQQQHVLELPVHQTREIQRIMEWFVKKTFLSPQRFWRICGSGSGCLIKESRNISLAHLHGKLLEQRLIIKPRRLSLFPAPPGGHWELLDCQIKPGFLKLRAEHVQERGKYSFFKTLYFLQQG